MNALCGHGQFEFVLVLLGFFCLFFWGANLYSPTFQFGTKFKDLRVPLCDRFA